MTVSVENLRRIEQNAELYNASKDKIITRIKTDIGIAIDKLKTKEKELLSEAEREFKLNPFSEFLSANSDDDNLTDEEANELLAKEKIPVSLVLDEESFISLLREIDSFGTLQNKSDPFSFIPKGLKAKSVTCDSIALSWDAVSDDCVYEIELRSSSSMKINHHSEKPEYTFSGMKSGTEYHIRVRAVFLRKGTKSAWCRPITMKTMDKFYVGVWKKCPNVVDNDKKYSVDEKNPRVATKDINGFCTIIGNTAIPLNTVTSWNIKIFKSINDGSGIFIGVAPFDINQNDGYYKCGWYFDCCWSALCSGPPHNYRGKKYGPRKENGQYVHTGDSVGVVMDTTKGELSFVLNGVNLGIAYGGIPLDKPLVPCVLLSYKGDSVELIPLEVKENEDSFIPIPSNITAKSTTWDSITLIWDEVGDASFYQIEVDESKSWDITTANIITRRGLLPETEHSFRVRTVRGNSVSKWSSVVKGRTLKKSLKTSVWKECPDGVDNDRKYSVDRGNPRVVTKDNDNGYCTIIGNTHIPLSKVTSWSVKVLKSKDNDGDGIFVGVAPNDINQNVFNYDKCGWYFYCYDSTLWSGPPHSYSCKEYGPREEDGQYVHTGDSVGVVVDTTKGDLSFVLDGVNLGIGFKGIPLDKPLVPCVLLNFKGDSVELDTSEVKENVDNSIPVPSNITAKSITCDSITLAWGEVNGASFYQIEMDGCKTWDASTTNTFTKNGLLPGTNHSFRVRAVRGSSVGEWSGVMKGKTQKDSFKASAWEDCPDVVGKNKKYNIDKKNPRIATKINKDDYCTIIGDTYIPSGTVTSWEVKLLKLSKNGKNIYIGVAPFDINQKNDNYDKCGWYLDCWVSTLCSGPPHKYSGKGYGLKKGNGQYVHTGDSVGVVVDTTKGDLSFVLSGVNHGVAYEKIPLDKPLVPCVILCFKGDSVELGT